MDHEHLAQLVVHAVGADDARVGKADVVAHDPLVAAQREWRRELLARAGARLPECGGAGDRKDVADVGRTGAAQHAGTR